MSVQTAGVRERFLHLCQQAQGVTVLEGELYAGPEMAGSAGVGAGEGVPGPPPRAIRESPLRWWWAPVSGRMGPAGMRDHV